MVIFCPTQPRGKRIECHPPAREGDAIRTLRRILGALGWALSGAFGLAFGLYVMQARSMPDLAPWHMPLLEDEFRAEDAGEGFAAYLAREQRLFDALEEVVRREGPSGPAAALKRFNIDSPINPANRPRNWNRSFEFRPREPRGAVLLVHGLSDSPYSTRAVAEVFRVRGFHVVGLRMPGHGTLPGALTRATWRDWRAAVRLGVRHLADGVGRDRPLILAGYSNGAALVTDYTIDAIEGSGDPVPSRLLLLSPALAVKPVAALARVQRRLATLPGLEKLGWTDILPEYDPYKYNSFPVYAGEQIYELTSQLGERIKDLVAGEGIERFPPTLVFQSAVDATVPPSNVVDRLLRKLGANGSEIVLFDVNRIARAEPFLRTGHADFVRSLVEARDLPFALTLITNAGPETESVVERTRAARATTWTDTPLDLAWPRGVYSLSHVALPFPLDDPVYGSREVARGPSPLMLGALELRGERGVFGVGMDQIMRLRHNPFFAYVEMRIAELIDALR